MHYIRPYLGQPLTTPQPSVVFVNGECIKKKIFIFGILERRIIYNYTEYGDTPACIGEKLDLDSQPGILQGFGQQPNETIGTLLEIPLRVLTNEDCYKDFLKESNQINSQVRNALYDGITDQILCSKLTCNENDFTGTSEKKWIKCVSYNHLRLHICVKIMCHNDELSSTIS